MAQGHWKPGLNQNCAAARESIAVGPQKVEYLGEAAADVVYAMRWGEDSGSGHWDVGTQGIRFRSVVDKQKDVSPTLRNRLTTLTR